MGIFIYIYMFCIFSLPDEKDRTLALQTLERKEGVDFDLWRSETKQNKETKNAKREKKNIGSIVLIKYR